MTDLPSNVAELLDRAQAALAEGKRADAEKLVVEGFGRVGYPSTGVSVRYPIASELPPLARAYAEQVIARALPAGHAWIPGGISARRWIGLDAPGPLEREVEAGGRRVPLWYALAAAEDAPRGTPERARPLAAVEALPMVERLAALAELARWAWTYRIVPHLHSYWTLAATGLGREGRAWARAVLERAEGDRHDTGENEDATFGDRLAFFALVRAGEPIAPAWDRFLPISTEVPIPIAVECAAALPLARLEAVAPELLRKCYAQQTIDLGTALLRHHDSQAIAERVLETTKRSAPHARKAEHAALAEIAKTKPGVAAALAKASADAPKARKLEVTWRSSPRSPSDLTPIMAKQLVEAGRLWDRKKLPVERRLSVDENDEAAIGAVLEHLRLSENGKPAFDAWLLMGDSGAFFVPNTTKVVALRIQRGIELASGKRDAALEEALASVRESEGAVRPLAEVKTATQAGAAKKPAAKTKKDAKQTKPAPKKKPAAKKRVAAATPKRAAAKKAKLVKKR